MKKLINISFIYFILSMIGGVFYREFTKFNNFYGKTSLSIIHLHLFALGTIIFLILSLFSINTNILEQKNFKNFLKLYNIALPFMIIMMVLKGIIQVLNINITSAISASISGIAGISHILILISFILLFLSLKNLNVDKNNIQ
ncbi:DUF2871 domain-containing protein [[Clostridium] colinum]|uniref:DUF2871 domain-containing protein n=1 Tax=[Clostridium] colinum TaxID=36835 RepID=UPI002024C542|nr:DUF2871 domain-containing protein [[Clostridium] colinum]